MTKGMRNSLLGRIKGTHIQLRTVLGGAVWPINPSFFHEAMVQLGYQDIRVNGRSITAVKPTHAFSSHVPEHFFQFDSDQDSILIGAQMEFLGMLERDYNVVMANHTAYYQMTYTCEHILDEPLDKTYATMLDGTDVRSRFEAATGLDLGLSKLEMSSGSNAGDIDWFAVEISTRVESSGNTLYCSMTRRSPDLEPVFKTAEVAQEIISRLVDSLTTRS